MTGKGSDLRPVWLILTDPFSSRIFFDCGIVERLERELGSRLTVAFLRDRKAALMWAPRVEEARIVYGDEIMPRDVGLAEKVARKIDRRLDREIGFFPLAVRLNLRHGFHSERMRSGHPNGMLDPDRIGPLPNRERVNRLMFRWYFNPRRYVPSPLLRRLREQRPLLVLSNVQMQVAAPFIASARRLGLPVVGYVASWDHAVGKGVVSPHLTRYLVQNEIMRADLERYHGIDPARVTITGWPQTDVFHRRRPRRSYRALLRRYRLDPERPLVLVMGNTPANNPYEARLVERLVRWWEKSAKERFSLLMRPHPRDRDWRERFAAALDRPGIFVQEPSFTDIETLALLLQHSDCVVANAGTILLDSLVNDRPAVCVLYDEGAPAGESWAVKNVLGEHYRELMRSDAFYRAESFRQLVRGIERALADPTELAPERAQVAREVVGEVDGRAAERVAAAITAVASAP